jgi:hypothetical protein
VKIKSTTFYKFKHYADVTYENTPIKGVTVTRDATGHWMSIENGNITVYGTNTSSKGKSGYAWDGCSPKFPFLDFILGTPDGVINLLTEKPKTYYASMVHDILYQYRDTIKPKISRFQVDKLFYQELKKGNFRWAFPYFVVVLGFGWLYWNDILRKHPKLIYLFLIPPAGIVGLIAWFLISCLF